VLKAPAWKKYGLVRPDFRVYVPNLRMELSRQVVIRAVLWVGRGEGIVAVVEVAVEIDEKWRGLFLVGLIGSSR